MSSGRYIFDLIEAYILREFSETPFHNFFHLGVDSKNSNIRGGTCSDKALAFKDRLAKLNVDARLHSAFIQGRETHRLLVVEVEGVRYFVDVGNAWPSIRLFSSEKQCSYSSFGITFETSLRDEFLDVYQIKEGRKSLSLEIPLCVKSEQDIYKKIDDRYGGDTKYPFTNSLRIAQVIGDEFIFLKERELRIFHPLNPMKSITLTNDNISNSINHYFGIDLEKCNIDLSLLLGSVNA